MRTPSNHDPHPGPPAPVPTAFLGIRLHLHRPGAGSARVEKMPEKGVHGRLGAMCGQIALDVLVVFAGAGLQLGQDGKIAFEQVASVIQ
jgi:hypothetical protein